VTNNGSEVHVTHLSDPELVGRTLQGDTTAFGPERFGNWLCIIARNECLLYLRQVHAIEASGRAFYDQACLGQAHLVPVEQQQELRHQQDYHERLGAAALRKEPSGAYPSLSERV
jgi:hypothetical protein